MHLCNHGDLRLSTISLESAPQLILGLILSGDAKAVLCADHLANICDAEDNVYN
jgi:hypothetical protein